MWHLNLPFFDLKPFPLSCQCSEWGVKLPGNTADKSTAGIDVWLWLQPGACDGLFIAGVGFKGMAQLARKAATCVTCLQCVQWIKVSWRWMHLLKVFLFDWWDMRVLWTDFIKLPMIRSISCSFLPIPIKMKIFLYPNIYSSCPFLLYQCFLSWGFLLTLNRALLIASVGQKGAIMLNRCWPHETQHFFPDFF